MELQREVCNLIITLLLTIVNVHPILSSSQNLYAFTTTVNIGTNDHRTDYTWSEPPSTTTSVFQDPTTYLPFSTSVQMEETLDASETSVQNQHAGPSYYHEDSIEDDDPEETSNHAIPYSEHEEARDVSTRPKYVAPGVWATPPPEKDIPLDFVPTKLHAQVRGTHTVKRLPQEEAIESAESDEERRNAPRLREVVTNSKVNTVYTEEGYEDSAYDHAGHVRDADFHEGFARKLHDRKDDRRDSSSKIKAGKHTNLVPEEFKEYEEDYQNHHLEEQSRKAIESSDGRDNLIGYERNAWEGTEIDPKLVAEDGIQKLKKDVEKDTAEVERSSKDYQNAQETKVRNDIKVDSSEESNQDEDDWRNEDNEPVKTKKKKKKKKKSKSQNEKLDAATKRTKPSRRLERKKKLRKNHMTTAVPSEETSVSANSEASPNPQNFVTNPMSSQVYSIDQTTLRYVAPITLQSSFQQIDEPTTVSYSQLFWDYFKAQQGPISTTTKSPMLEANSTILNLNPQLKEQTPVAVATIDGRGPYLLVTKQETTTSPFLDFHPQDSFSDHLNFDPRSVHTRHLLGQKDDESGYVGNVIAATSTVATFTSVQPLLLQSSSPAKLERSSSTTVLDDSIFSSTPTVMTLNITQEAYSRIANYHENPFLAPILDNSNIAVTRNNIKYKVLVRPTKKIVKPVNPQSINQQISSPSSLQESDEKKRLRDELNAKYIKMFDYIKNKSKIQEPLSERKKVLSPENLTLMRPPIPQRVYPIFSTDRLSIADHSSVTVESESPRKETNWKSSLQDRHRFQPIKLPYRFDSFPVTPSVHLTYRKDSFPATKLLPPPPQSSFANTYANYHSNSQNDHHFSYGKPQQRQQRDNAFRYFPLVPEASWKTHFRRKRSEQGEFCNGLNRNDAAIDVKAETNNSVTNEGKPEQRDKSLFSRVIDKSKGKSSCQRITDALINVPGATRSASFAGLRDSESGTSPTLMSKSSAATNGESENTEDLREAVIDRPKLAEEKSVLIQSTQQSEQTNVTNADLRNETQSEINLKDRMKRGDDEDLLDESPKISGDVIDKEIAARFNENDDNETETVKMKENEKVEVDVPNFDYVEEFAEDSLVELSTTTEPTIDLKKYPFYNNEEVPNASALRYIVDPKTIPHKTARGMEFYKSRNAYKQCDEVEPNLDKVLPEKEEPDPEREDPQEDLPRLRGLGEKLDCFKAKYFDENPLDNPLFSEKLVEEPTPPFELNPAKFASRILVLPEEDDEYVVQQISKKPERHSRQWRNRNRPYDTHESIRVNYKHDPQTGRGRNAYLHTVRGTKQSNVARRKKNNQRLKPKILSTSTTQSPKSYQTASYQNQVYEDVMGNIRNMVNTYEVHEITTLPPTTQATAESETALKIANVTSPPKEKDTTLSDVIDVTSSPKLSMIKGLVPPPKYSVLRQTAGYRKHRPSGKSRSSLLRSSNLPRIIAHHHTIKINKRSVTEETARNSSAINKDEKIEASAAVVGNDTISMSVHDTTQEANATSEMSDLAIEESRQVGMQDRSLSTTLKIDDRKRRNPSSSDQKNEPRQKIVYTIRDRIRYSKPKWDTMGFGKFSTSPKTIDEDNRRKEPRYNHFKRKKKPRDERRNNSTILNSTENTWRIESATSPIGDRESDTTELYHPEESVVHDQIMYDRKDEPDRESKNTESLEDTKSEENSEDEMENTTNTYQVHENIDENVSSTTTKSTNPPEISKEISRLREYLESDPPGYAETFPEETTTPSKTASVNYESDGHEEKQQDEEINYPQTVASPWHFSSDSSEKAEEQIETPTRTETSSTHDDDSEELSKEEEGSNKQQTFFTYTKRPTSADSNEKDDEEESEKATFYHPFPFSKYKSKLKKESDESDSEEKSDEEKSEDYVFPWHADKGNKRKRLRDTASDRYEYPWERRERLAKERREKQKRANRFKKLIFDDEDEEESTRRERPVYPWERYDVPSRTRVNARRDISRRYVKDNEESSSEPSLKFSSKYASSNVKPTRSSRAREISRSIKKILNEDTHNESKEETSKEVADHSPSFARKSSLLSERGISRGRLVPENITEPPKRKTGRRRASRVDENGSSNSRFNSKRLRETDEEDESAVEHLRPNENNFDKDNPDSQIETTSSQPNQFNSTTEISSTGQRMKRRRRIPKNNSTISVESTTVSAKRKRRKPQVSTTTSTNIDLETSRSVFIPVRKKYSETDKIVKTNNSNSERSDYLTGTPKTGTLERRSRISKEKIVRKTIYPNQEENFSAIKVNATRKEPEKELKIVSRKDNNKPIDDGNNNNKKEHKNEKEDYDKLLSKDEIKKSAILESEDNPLKSFGVKKEEVEKIHDFSIHDRIINDQNDNDGDFGTTLETSAMSSLLHNILPSRVRNDRRPQNESSNANENWKKRNTKGDGSAEGTRRPSLLQPKYKIEDPERRLYYYVE